jgi:hypothetical protein
LLRHMDYRPGSDNSTDSGDIQAPRWLGGSNAV